MSERVKPIPDGYVSISLVHPRNPISPTEYDYYVRYNFNNIKYWVNHKEDGLHFYFEDYMEVVPWTNIRDYQLHYNSAAYRAAIATWKLSCDHDWKPQVAYDTAGEPYNYMLCPKCESNDAQIRNLEQERADRERGIVQ